MITQQRARWWLRRTLIAASVLLLVLSLGGWIRSRWVGDQVIREWGDHQGRRGVGFAHGGGAFCLFCFEDGTAPTPAGKWSHTNSGTTDIAHRMAGPIRGLWNYGWCTWDSSATRGRVRAIVLPYWLLTLLGCSAPAWWALGWKQRLITRRRATGCCVNCGYDLRGSPDRCPECGAVPAAGATR